MYFTGLELFFPEKHEKDEKTQYTKKVIKQMIIGTSYFPSDELIGQAVDELKELERLAEIGRVIEKYTEQGYIIECIKNKNEDQPESQREVVWAKGGIKK